ncbi:MAG TPA: TonB family protein [Gammaproteobacteria bacterium]|nr:TonB family protein [Gammaproteobacteria bacterium]
MVAAGGGQGERVCGVREVSGERRTGFFRVPRRPTPTALYLNPLRRVNVMGGFTKGQLRMAVSSHTSALAIGYRLGEYRIERLLGHGGFGLTYLAHDTNLNAHVAIKEFLPGEVAARGPDSTVVPKSESDTDSYRWGLDRFKEEARALARFKHPNIVRVARLLEANGTAYMVMDFELGMTLGQYLKRVEATLDAAQLLGVFMPLFDGLEALHRAGLVHRDIKPGNIYLRASGAPMLIDFGAVRQAIGAHSRNLTAVVTPGFAPIEQYSSEGRQGPWSDLYALGATMYMCLFGTPPIDAARRSVAISEGNDDPYAAAVKEGADRYPRELLESIDWALQFRIRDRPQHARELRERLQAVPVSPRPLEIPASVVEEYGVLLHDSLPPDDERLRQTVPRAAEKTVVQAPPEVRERDSAVLLHAHAATESTRPRATGRTSPQEATQIVAPPSPSSTQSDVSALGVQGGSGVDFELPAPESEETRLAAAPATTPAEPRRDDRAGHDRVAARRETVPEATPSMPPMPRPGAFLKRAVWAGAALSVAAFAIAGYFWLDAEERRTLAAAERSDTPAGYRAYLQRCVLCTDRQRAEAALRRFDLAERAARLKAEFEVLLLRGRLVPPDAPNAAGVLEELELIARGDPFLPQARASLEAALAARAGMIGNAAEPKKTPSSAQPLAERRMTDKTTGSLAHKPAPTPSAAGSLDPKDRSEATERQPEVAGAGRPAAIESAAPPEQADLATASRPTEAVPEVNDVSHAPAPTRPAPAAAVPPPAGQGAGPVVRNATPLDTPLPPYPREAYHARKEGWVIVEFTVTAQGTVEDVAIIEANPRGVFESAVRRTVVKWRFAPATVDGVPQAMRLRQRIDFKP